MIDDALTDYEREWLVELEAEKLYKKDYPTGGFGQRLPKFRRAGPDPMRDHYRQLAREQLRKAGKLEP